MQLPKCTSGLHYETQPQAKTERRRVVKTHASFAISFGRLMWVCCTFVIMPWIMDVSKIYISGIQDRNPSNASKVAKRSLGFSLQTTSVTNLKTVEYDTIPLREYKLAKLKNQAKFIVETLLQLCCFGSRQLSFGKVKDLLTGRGWA